MSNDARDQSLGTLPPGCCGLSASRCASCFKAPLSRRSFLAGSGSAAAAPSAGGRLFGAARPAPGRLPLRVQPVFLFTSRQRRERTSWRWSAEIYGERQVAEECERIRRELETLKRGAEFPLEILPLVPVDSKEQAARISPDGYDAAILYASARNPDVLEALAKPEKWNLIFLRHKSGPIYYMYIGLHGHMLRKQRDSFLDKSISLDDVVVDEYPDLLWRLRALGGLKNTLGRRILTIGNPGGWGAGGRLAPERARERWAFDLVSTSYADLERRLKSALGNTALTRTAVQSASRYAARKGVRLEASRDALSKAFVLLEVFRDCLQDTGAGVLTINGCMGTVMGVSGTTACVPLSVLNDEGLLALCEGDFVSAPAGVLLHFISGRPVFMCNGSFPYGGVVLASHCTAPSRMDGTNGDPVRVLTHYESDFGAAPRVEMRKGQTVTVLDADFDAKRYLGFRGEIRDTPFHPICRTQLEIGVAGDGSRLAGELRGWHWMICYGDYVKEAGYAARKAGLDWLAA